MWLWIVAIAVFILLCWALDDLVSAAVLMVMGLLVVSCNQSERYQTYTKEQDAYYAAERKREATPRLYSEKDGCKVYTFKGNDRWQFFTTCGTSTTTETTYQVTCGKNCKRVESDVHVTEVKK